MKKRNFFSLLCRFLILGITFITLIVMWGWLNREEAILRIIPSAAPMQFNTAVGLLLSGLALALPHRYRLISALFACAAFLIGFLTLVEYVSGINVGIDTFFITPFNDDNVSTPGRMAPYTAAAFILASMTIFMHVGTSHLKYRAMVVVVFLGSILIAIGVVPILANMGGIETAHAWGGPHRVALSTALCFVMVGACIVVQVCLRNENILVWLPVPVFVGFITIAILLSTAVRSEENKKFDADMQLQAEGIAKRMELQLTDLYRALDRIAVRWSAANGTPRDIWEADAKAYLQGYSFLSGLSHADTDTRLQWSEPWTEKSAKAMGFKLDSEPFRAEALNKARETHQPQVTRPLTLLSGEKGYLYVIPLYSNGHEDGFQIAVFHIDTLFNMASLEGEAQKVYITLSDGDVALYSTLPRSSKIQHDWDKTVSIQNMNSAWSLKITPTKEFLASKNSYISLIALFVGFFVAILVSLCTYLGLKWYYQNEALNKVNANLAQAEELKRKIIDSSGYMIIATDSKGVIHTFNTAAEKDIGYKAKDIIGIQTPALWHEPAEVATRAAELTAQLNRTVQPGFEVFTTLPLEKGVEESEWTFIRKDGSRFPARLNATVLRDENGEIVGYLGVAKNISEEKENVRLRQELIAKLTESNTELERFAYVASHDMQEPLRMITNFSALIGKEYSSKLDRDGQEYLQLVSESSKRMQSMVEDLLEYARVGNDAVRFALINSTDELQHVLDNLSSIIKEQNAVITHDALPEVTGNPVQFMRLLQNLIGNGLKYQAANTRPHLHVGVEDQGPLWRFYVRDNGIGMQPEYAKQVFEPFRRLHTWQEYKGTGIGLAVCKKIVEGHGGTIWVTSELNKGSIFFFTLPKTLAEET